jgi:tetratricopeptide (TPR) repeat protein
LRGEIILTLLVTAVIAMLLAPCLLARFSPSVAPTELSASDHLVRGVKMGNAEDYDRALEEFEQAIALDPNLADAYYNRGVIHKRRAEWMKAKEEFDRALAIEPQFIDALYERASVHRALGHHSEAIADLELCLTLLEDIPEADGAHLEDLIQEIKQEAELR